MSKFAGITKSVRRVMKKHGPEILTGIGIAGMLGATVMAVKATPKALRLMEAKKEELEVDTLTPVETVKTCWKCYAPTVITSVTSVACIIGASSINMRRNAALLTAYTISESALKEYHDKVVETIGEKKESLVRDAIAKDKLDNDPVTNHDVIITGKGDTLCYESVSGRYFKSDIEKLKQIVNELNRRMLLDDCISLNDFYDEIGLDHTMLGNELGWNINDGYIDINFRAQLASDGTPALVIDHHVPPKYDYARWA